MDEGDASARARVRAAVPATPARARTASLKAAHPFTTPARRPVAPTPARTASRYVRTPAAPQAPQRRLVIHKLVLDNFKSYAGRQEIGPFHKSFSSVVGPNGSGKSNVIDALLFVFGWRANKMRQGRLSELIHSRDGVVPPAQCTVEVWFREIVDTPDSEAFEVVPGSRLIVARSAQRNNTSQYTINGKRSSFTEVTALLRQRGIDLDHKRFLILQGEVESIAQMPPKARTEHDEGLLEYLEDIIGTSDLKEPIETHAHAVDEANEARAEKLHRVQIVQRELGHLESRRRDAEAYLRAHNALMRHQSALWQRYVWDAGRAAAAAAAERAALEARLAEEAHKHADAQQASEAAQRELDAVRAAAADIEAQAQAGAQTLARHEKHHVELRARAKLLQGKRKKLATRLADDQARAAEARTAAAQARDELAHIATEQSAHEAALEREQAALQALGERLAAKTRPFHEEIEARQQELAPWAAQIQARTAERNVAREERAVLAERAAEAAQRREDAALAVRDLRAAAEARAAESEALRAEQASLADKAADDAAQLDAMRAEEDALRRAAHEARRAADDAAAAAAASASQGEVLQSLTRQAELGLLSGLHGRLGSLGAIDDRYDRAVSTACRALNDLVVDTVEAGQQCIEHLRKHRLGRARFLVLDKIRAKTEAMAPISTPEGVPRLFDLIRCKDARYAPVFYAELGDTLVARDLAQATRIAYGKRRWRVVTEDGQLIDKSGTMSGGGGKPRQGLMGTQLRAGDVSQAQVERLQRDAQLAQQQLDGHRASVAQLASLHAANEQRVPEIQRRLALLEMDVRAGAQRVADAEAHLASLTDAPDARADADAARAAELDAALEAHDAALAELEGAAARVQDAIRTLQEQILDAGGVELRTLQSKVEGVRGMLALGQERQAKVEVTQATAEGEVRRIEAAHATSDAQLAQLDAELAEVEAQSAAAQRDVDAAREALDAARYDADAQSEKRAELEAQLEEHARALRAFRKLEVDTQQKREDLQRRAAEQEKQVHSWQKRLAELALHDVPDAPPAQEASREPPSEPTRVKTEAMDVEVPDAEPAGEAERPAEDAAPPATDGDASAEAAPAELPELDEAALAAVDVRATEAAIAELESRLARDTVNLEVLDEYRKTEETFLARARDLELTTAARDEAQGKLEALRKERLERFMDGFSQISLKLKEMYQTITLGGNAELELVDSLDPFSEGIIFSVMPPKKSWKNISNLSGGEKTLSSLALVFALHAYKPTPLYVMDEIDAALDFRNVSIIANIIKERTRGAQFIIISLRNNMFELSSRLVGVYKTNNCTKSLAIDNTDLHRKERTPARLASPAKLAASPTKASGTHAPLL
ncbi:Structural maintenance of chromosomes protein 4 [Malassezia brasiliensis]|uniref:Structural maintenance of chromosomes protein n=1 Tax=Malassezia brasiliensis TaxID=1821822 RepID=A0AAF0DW88_9BASI|nr:Structural maintenance of chromosomes protein 4 [Malassezia brasiliensis]